MTTRISAVKTTTANGRFGVMAAVTPQKWQCEFESLYPAGSVVGAATTPSRWDVVRKRGDSAVDKVERIFNLVIINKFQENEINSRHKQTRKR